MRCKSTYPGSATLLGRPVRCELAEGHSGQHGHSYAARYWDTSAPSHNPAPVVPFDLATDGLGACCRVQAIYARHNAGLPHPCPSWGHGDQSGHSVDCALPVWVQRAQRGELRGKIL